MAGCWGRSHRSRRCWRQPRRTHPLRDWCLATSSNRSRPWDSWEYRLRQSHRCLLLSFSYLAHYLTSSLPFSRALLELFIPLLGTRANPVLFMFSLTLGADWFFSYVFFYFYPNCLGRNGLRESISLRRILILQDTALFLCHCRLELFSFFSSLFIYCLWRLRQNYYNLYLIWNWEGKSYWIGLV